MTQQEERTQTPSQSSTEKQKVSNSPLTTSKRVTDHLANERTFLAWVRTAISVIAFGFVVERFGLLLRELGVKSTLVLSTHASSVVGVTLTVLGVVIMIVALINFLHIRRSIDQEHFHPPAIYAIVLTILVSIIGVILAAYLLYTS